MRILSLCNCPLDESLGSGYVALGFARGLRARGHSVEALGPADYEPLRRLGRGTGYRQALGMAAASLRRLRTGSWDVVEFWGGEAWLALSLLARRPRRRFLLVCRSNGLEPHAAEALRAAATAGLAADSRRWYQRDLSRLWERGFRAADALITVGDFDRDFAAARAYAPPHRLLAVDNPLPDDYLGLAVDAERPPVIGYCGSWLPRKGAALLAAALPAALRALPAWKLVLVGVGSGFRLADHFPADLQTRIEVVPFAERGGLLRELYRSFRIAVVPSLYESFGLAAAEAMASGAALVATRVGFAAGLRDGEEAVLLPAPAPQHLEAAIVGLAGDEERRRAVARGGHRRAQRLRWDDALVAIEEAYGSWLDELRRSVRARGEG